MINKKVRNRIPDFFVLERDGFLRQNRFWSEQADAAQRLTSDDGTVPIGEGSAV